MQTDLTVNIMIDSPETVTGVRHSGVTRGWEGAGVAQLVLALPFNLKDSIETLKSVLMDRLNPLIDAALQEREAKRTQAVEALDAEEDAKIPATPPVEAPGEPAAPIS